MQRLWDWGLPALAIVGLGVGSILALGVAPAEEHMAEVYRILYVHVPAAWAALVAFTVTFIASVTYLFKASSRADAIAEASAHVGVFFGALLIVLGAIWGKPTFGVWWDWDPRLTTTAIMLFAFAGYLALRRFVDDPERRATWSAVTAIIIFVDVPVVWFSVRWWGGLHQIQSSPETVGAMMATALRVNAVAFLACYGWFLRLRYLAVKRRLDTELAEPPEDPLPGGAR
jgi:heme exporter protein C